jgi:hypothetical protein
MAVSACLSRFTSILQTSATCASGTRVKAPVPGSVPEPLEELEELLEELLDELDDDELEDEELEDDEDHHPEVVLEDELDDDVHH